MPNARKRPIEINDVLPNRDSDMLGDMKVLNEWEKNKRNKATTTEQEWQHQVGRAPVQIQEQKVSEFT